MSKRNALESLVEALLSTGAGPALRDTASLAATAARLDLVETRLGWRMPEPYRSLVHAYRYPTVETDHLQLFGSEATPADTALETQLFSDPILSTWLIRHRCLQIGRPGAGGYDPVCLDLTTAGRDGPVVVVFDHEAILLGKPRVPRREAWASMLDAVLDRAVFPPPRRNDAIAFRKT